MQYVQKRFLTVRRPSDLPAVDAAANASAFVLRVHGRQEVRCRAVWYECVDVCHELLSDLLVPARRFLLTLMPRCHQWNKLGRVQTKLPELGFLIRIAHFHSIDHG